MTNLRIILLLYCKVERGTCWSTENFVLKIQNSSWFYIILHYITMLQILYYYVRTYLKNFSNAAQTGLIRLFFFDIFCLEVDSNHFAPDHD